MSQQYDDTNRGALFKNTKKETDKHPDYKGSINVGGTEYWVSSWLKVSGKGEKYLSLSVQPKEQAKPAPVQRQAASQTLADMDSDIPFNNPYKGQFSYVV
jgi:uncharacterized protein (DUF736 family)